MIDQRQPVLGSEHQPRDAGSPQRLIAGTGAPAAVACRALPDERQGKGRIPDEIAGADRRRFSDQRCDLFVDAGSKVLGNRRIRSRSTQ